MSITRVKHYLFTCDENIYERTTYKRCTSSRVFEAPSKEKAKSLARGALWDDSKGWWVCPGKHHWNDGR